MNSLRKSSPALPGGNRGGVDLAPSWLAEPAAGLSACAMARGGNQQTPMLAADHRLIVKVADGLQFLAPDAITWIEAQGAAVKICAHGECLEVRESLRMLEQKLDPQLFVRVHRSYIVNIRGVRKVTAEAYGDRLLHMVDGARIRVSRSHRPTLESRLGVKI